MKVREHPIIVRSVRSDFVRIFGLTEDEREKLAKCVRKLRNMESNAPVVVQYGLHGWLEVKESGISRHLYEERVKLTNAFRDRIVQIVNSTFPRKC